MFLHLGYDVSVSTRDIIAIYDYVGFFVKDNPDNKRYFARCKAEGKVADDGFDGPRQVHRHHEGQDLPVRHLHTRPQEPHARDLRYG